MKHFGIELEFFTYGNNGSVLVPAYQVTNNLDGNPVVGEIKTGVFSSMVDLIFDLKKRIYLEQRFLADKNCQAVFISQVKGDSAFRKALRKDRAYINAKNLEQLEEFSIYEGGELSKEIEELGVYRASLQINISDNTEISHSYTDKDNKDRSFKKSISNVFDYYKVISRLDKAFERDIKEADRNPGVYALKDGTLGTRVEYRSLPNSINLDKLLEINL